LPRAHVEAPVSGSMILAGVLLKLGGYGLYRVMILLVGVIINMGRIFICYGIVGGLLVGFICLCQYDVRVLIAYSSVCHMSIVLGGLLGMRFWGVRGRIFIMVGHGICSSGLFYMANVFYERLFRRRLVMMRGLGLYLGE